MNRYNFGRFNQIHQIGKNDKNKEKISLHFNVYLFLYINVNGQPISIGFAQNERVSTRFSSAQTYLERSNCYTSFQIDLIKIMMNALTMSIPRN